MNVLTRERDAAIPRGRDFDLTGRVIIVTGGGQGIGREYAKQFAAAGANPVIAELNGERAAGVASEIEAAGGRALAVETDVGASDSVDALVAKAIHEFGRIDGLVNNAAIFTTLKKKPIDEISLEEWNRVMHVNVTGCFLTQKAVLPHMRAAGWGRIINISSAAVPTGTTHYLHYVTSKSALIGMTNALAREVGATGITVNAVIPGGTFTEIPRETITEEGKKRLLASQCIPRAGEPMDLVGLVLFLCSEASGFITGQTIACDGGLTHW